MSIDSSAHGRPVNLNALALAFFLSGFAALIYQIAWQRTLYIAFGVDIESVTVIVSIFMLGLGAGGILGGRLADRFPKQIPLIFCATECLIALVGLISIDVISFAGHQASGAPTALVALLTFALLLPPTLLMGATLPMLATYAARINGNVGVATGGLYFINTLGAAVGAFIGGFVLLYWLDLREATWVAAVANGISAATIAIALWRRKNV